MSIIVLILSNKFKYDKVDKDTLIDTNSLTNYINFRYNISEIIFTNKKYSQTIIKACNISKNYNQVIIANIPVSLESYKEINRITNDINRSLDFPIQLLEKKDDFIEFKKVLEKKIKQKYWYRYRIIGFLSLLVFYI